MALFLSEERRNGFCRNFERKQLGQLKTVYPEAYEYRLAKVSEKFGQRSRPEKFELIVAPNLETGMYCFTVPTGKMVPDRL